MVGGRSSEIHRSTGRRSPAVPSVRAVNLRKMQVLPAVGAVAGSIALAGCSAANETAAASGGGAANESSAQQLSGTLNGAGSSAQQAAMQAWTASFSGGQPGVTVNYDPVG